MPDYDVGFLSLSLQIEFLNVASTALIQQPNFFSVSDPCRKALIKLVKTLKELDPEFVLKVSESYYYSV